MLITATDLGHRFANQPVLFRGITFTFRPGRLVGLVGPSGTGKSTLLSILAGATPPAFGTLTLRDIDSIGWILQSPVGVPRRTVIDQVALPFLFRGYDRARADNEALTLLSVFGLDRLADRELRFLSGGEAQRFAFARASAASYDVLLLDEPTASLDPTTSQTVRQVIRGLVSESRVVVLATHDQVLREECDDLIVLGAL